LEQPELFQPQLGQGKRKQNSQSPDVANTEENSNGQEKRQKN